MMFYNESKGSSSFIEVDISIVKDFSSKTIRGIRLYRITRANILFDKIYWKRKMSWWNQLFNINVDLKEIRHYFTSEDYKNQGISGMDLSFAYTNIKYSYEDEMNIAQHLLWMCNFEPVDGTIFLSRIDFAAINNKTILGFYKDYKSKKDLIA